MEFQPLQSLAKTFPPQELFHRWLADGQAQADAGPFLANARGELHDLLAGAPLPESGPSPFFKAVKDTAPGQAWMQSLAADFSGSSDVENFQDQIEQLGTGQASCVVTGQQPGWLGGPLYTLYKAATTIALAQRLHRPERPVVPVFWLGDDDDDLVEAMQPVAWDPLAKKLVESSGPGEKSQRQGPGRPCVGNLPCGQFSSAVAEWLADMESQGLLSDLGGELNSLWQEAVQKDWPWTRLFRKFLLKVFAGQGLIVLSGNDPFLHEVAAPLYQTIVQLRNELSQLARKEGLALAEAGYSQPISDRSLFRNLYLSSGQGREFLPLEVAEYNPSLLRPGVLLRSPVQDWLLQPRAVVVGPGERAYLRQLLPVYQALDIPRSYLVPRLFAWLIPEELRSAAVASSGQDSTGEKSSAEELARGTADVLEAEIQRVLTQELEVDPERARDLATGRTRRLMRGLVTLFSGEMIQKDRQLASRWPGWFRPRGKRQERILAGAGTVAFGGFDLVEAMLEAARKHLDLGLEGNWQEFAGDIPAVWESNDD